MSESDNLNQCIVKWITASLEKKDKSRIGLASALGIGPSQVTIMLNGGRRVRADELATIARYLGERKFEAPQYYIRFKNP